MVATGKPKRASSLLGAVLAGLIGALATAPAAGAVPVVDGEFPVSTLGSNNKIAAGPDGNVWVTLSDATNDVAKITPAGAVEEFNLEANNPQGITAGPGGLMWITQNGGVKSFLPGDPEGTDKLAEINEILNNHSIVLGPDGNLWVATDGFVFRIPPGDPENETGFPVAGLAAKDIDVAGQNLVVADSGGENRVLSVSTAGVVTPMPVEGPSQGVAGNPSGQFAYTVPDKGIGLLAPGAAPLFSAFPGSDTFGAALGTDGAYWVAEGFGQKLIRVTAENQATTLGGLPAGFVSRQITAGPGNTLWVTLENFELADKVARVSGVDPPPPAPISAAPAGKRPETRIAKGPKGKVKTKKKKATVKFRFTSPDAGVRFECALVKVKKRKKGKPAPRPKFKGCKSPKAYRLKPGRYRFEVRAVLNGLADPSPAKRSFRVVRAGR